MSEWFQDFRGCQLELSHPLGWMSALPNGARASTPYLSFPASLPGKWAGGPWSRKSYWKSRANNGLFCYSNCYDLQMLCCCFLKSNLLVTYFSFLPILCKFFACKVLFNAHSRQQLRKSSASGSMLSESLPGTSMVHRAKPSAFLPLQTLLCHHHHPQRKSVLAWGPGETHRKHRSS